MEHETLGHAHWKSRYATFSRGDDLPRLRAARHLVARGRRVAASASAAPFTILPTQDPDASLRFAGADGVADKAPLVRPKPWLVEDPNLEALLPMVESVQLEEGWRVGEIYVSNEKKTLVLHR